MVKSDLCKIADERAKDIDVLIKNRRYSAAYYLSGYIIETALKACIAGKTRKNQFPDKETVDASYTHDLDKLMGIAELRPYLYAEFKTNNNATLERYWALVSQWSEKARYLRHTRLETLDLYEAIMDVHNGLYQWIKQYWKK